MIMSVDTIYSVIFYSGGLLLLGLWVWFWGDWKKRHPGHGVDTWLWERWKQNHPDFDSNLIQDKVRRNWATVAMVLGLVLAIWGLSGWTPAGSYSIGGLSSGDREALVLGTALFLTGWFGRRR
jgi:hypothetical protein